ncbi:MAG: hypothetical protein Q9195_003045 [Heterodermia aff. obscurata]
MDPARQATIEDSNFKQRQPDQPAVFCKEGNYQPITSSVSFTERHVKPSTAPPTGSPTLAPKPGYRHRPEDDILVQPLTQSCYSEAPRVNNPPVSFPAASNPSPKAHANGLNDLPIEIHNTVMDYLAGSLGSLSSVNSKQSTRNWSHAMRHPRRKQLSDLALVSKLWRSLIQERLYRHIKIKGTRSELQACGDWFLTHPRFQRYVRHVEVWVPLFEISRETRPRVVFRPPQSPTLENLPPSRLHFPSPTFRTSTTRAFDNATLEEIFGCARVLFVEACILTLEGGHCKKSRQIQHFRNGSELKDPLESKTTVEESRTAELLQYRRFPEHQKINTLILKGSWNIIRCTADFQNLVVALPSLREWHCIYAKPKTDAYKAMCGALRSFPPTIRKLNICLEGLNGKQPSPLSKWRKLFPQYHICRDLGRIFPQLEGLSYTGHVCSCLFKSANASVANFRSNPGLKSLDLFVRNVCRDSNDMDNGPSIHNWPFIQAFESLIIEAIASLAVYPLLSYVRIRFLDLDSPRPLLNPYWHYEKNHATGVWSSKITAALNRARPDATSHTLDDDNFMDVYTPGWTGGRPRSLQISRYASLDSGF